MLVITRKGRGKLNLLIKQAARFGDLTNRQQRVGGILDYIETWGPIDESTDELLIEDGSTSPSPTFLVNELVKSKDLERT